jgi:hypothetical protein
LRQLVAREQATWVVDVDAQVSDHQGLRDARLVSRPVAACRGLGERNIACQIHVAARQGVEGMLSESYQAIGWHISVQSE